MPKKPHRESLELEDLGNLEHYSEDELLWLREKLIADVERIQKETAQVGKRIKELGHSRHLLQEEHARRGKALRAVKHVITLRNVAAGGGATSVAPVVVQRGASARRGAAR
jgi:hypothetical protein